jgi:hypothetical protein
MDPGFALGKAIFHLGPEICGPAHQFLVILRKKESRDFNSLC